MKELNTLGEESLVPCFFAALGFRYVFMWGEKNLKMRYLW
jgi:hypothetical protein